MDPFAEVEESKDLSPNGGFDRVAYEKWRDKDEELLIECLMQLPGKEGCQLYESKRGRGFA